MRQNQKEGKPRKSRDYVQLAKFLLVMAVPPHQLEEVLGDFEEMMRIAERKLGPQGARKVFIFQIVTTLTCFTWYRVKSSRAVRWLFAIGVAVLAARGNSYLAPLLHKFITTLQ